MKTIYKKHLTVVCIFTLIGLMSGCDKLKKPSSDSTPPKLTWKVYFFETSSEQTVTSSGQTVKVKKGKEVRVTLIAEDTDGGVSKISFGGGFNYGCISGSEGQNSNGLLSTDVQNLSPDADGYVLPSIFLMRNFTMDFTCNPGYTLTGGKYELVGQAENYFGGNVNSMLYLQLE
jgi:hypothetical protein